MDKSQILIGHTSIIPSTLVEELHSDLINANITVECEKQDNGPQAGLEWFAIPALAVFFAKPFYDAFAKRAAEDFADAVYPSVKTAIAKAVKKVRLIAIKVVSTAEHKVSDPANLLFSVYTISKDGKKLKFLFGNDVTSESIDIALDSMMRLMTLHHINDANDELSKEISLLSNPKSYTVLLRFDINASTWHVLDWQKDVRSKSIRDRKTIQDRSEIK